MRAFPASLEMNLIVIPGLRHLRLWVRQIVLGLTLRRAPSGATKSPGAAATRTRGAVSIAFPAASLTAPTLVISTAPASPACQPEDVSVTNLPSGETAAPVIVR